MAPFLEPCFSPLGALLDGSRAEKKCSCAALGRPKTTSKTVFSHLGGQKAPKTEPGKVPNRAPEATRAENSEILIFIDSSMNFNDFAGPGAPLWRNKNPKLVPNRVFDAEALRKPLENLLERSWRLQGPIKSYLKRRLTGPRGLPRQFSAKKGSQMDPQKRCVCLCGRLQVSTTALRTFKDPKRGPK